MLNLASKPLISSEIPRTEESTGNSAFAVQLIHDVLELNFSSKYG
jgi:hypothetical protein